MSTARPFITPTYQANLNAAIRDVVYCLNHNLIMEGWRCLKTLHLLVTPPVREDVQVKMKYDEIRMSLHRFGFFNGSMDWTLTRASQKGQLLKFLNLKNDEFFQVLINSLHKNGYLEMSVKPLVSGRRGLGSHLGEDSDEQG